MIMHSKNLGNTATQAHTRHNGMAKLLQMYATRVHLSIVEQRKQQTSQFCHACSVAGAGFGSSDGPRRSQSHAWAESNEPGPSVSGKNRFTPPVLEYLESSMVTWSSLTTGLVFGKWYSLPSTSKVILGSVYFVGLVH